MKLSATAPWSSRSEVGLVATPAAVRSVVAKGLSDRAQRVSQWVEQHEYRAYDPGDGQRSPYARWLRPYPSLQRWLTAAVLRSPVNLRPLLGITPHTSTKAMGYMAWGYTLRYRQGRDPIDSVKAKACLQWLMDHRSACPSGAAWGNHFDFTTRAGRIAKGEPTIVWTSLIAQAFLAAYDTWGDEQHWQVAKGACQWIDTLPRHKTAHGVCLSYVPTRQLSVHNANMLGAAILAEVGRREGRGAWQDLAHEAMRYSCEHQQEDGAWLYAQEPRYHWIDNFHTGYNLDSLHRYNAAVPKAYRFELHELRGWRYFRSRFFDRLGRPRYTPDRLWPVDIQCVAQSIDTLTLLRQHDRCALDQAEGVARWAVHRMQDPTGYFYYRDHGWFRSRIPMLHWGQATMFKALTHLSGALNPDFAGSSCSTS